MPAPPYGLPAQRTLYTLLLYVSCTCHGYRAGATNAPKPNFHDESPGCAGLGNTSWSISSGEAGTETDTRAKSGSSLKGKFRKEGLSHYQSQEDAK